MTSGQQLMFMVSTLWCVVPSSAARFPANAFDLLSSRHHSGGADLAEPTEHRRPGRPRLLPCPGDRRSLRDETRGPKMGRNWSSIAA